MYVLKHATSEFGVDMRLCINMIDDKIIKYEIYHSHSYAFLYFFIIS